MCESGTEADKPSNDLEATMQGKKIKRVFISHRSEDKDVADMLISFLSRLGVSVEEFFCSSIPANGVEQYVSIEVKQAIRNSKINIVVLSKSYYESVYCLNEAGVLWYLDDIPVITITLPEITHDKIVGFFGKDSLPCKLDREEDISRIYTQITDVLEIPQKGISFANDASKKLIREYKEYIGKRQKPSLSIEDELDRTKKELENALVSAKVAESRIQDLRMLIYKAYFDPSVLTNNVEIDELISDMQYEEGFRHQHSD